MRAPYNWWGSNTATGIDALIEDMLDNNGGGWVNYSPFYTSAAMNQVDWNGTSPSNIPLGRVLSGTLFFPKTMTANNSPYYLVGPWTIAPGVRITIDAGVQVYANTTNATVLVYGELHTLGTSTNPVTFGVNPSVSWTQTSGYWNGIRGASPSQGSDALVLRNTTVSGPTNYWYTPGQSWTGNSNLFHFEHFFRNNGDVIVDNVTMRDAVEVFIKPFNSNYNSLTVNNLVFDNISMLRAEGQSFYRSCGGDWRNDVTVRRTSVNFEYPTYTSTTNSYCNWYKPVFENWTYEQSDIRLYAPGSWTTPSATNPAYFSGHFTDTTVELASSSNWNGPLQLRHSTFNTTGSPSATAWSYSQYASQRTDSFLRAGSSSYGKWIVENNSFDPTNGWTVIDYTYQNNRMTASYNWWGSNNRTIIDSLIEDISDNNGGNWVNYCPMWDTPAMTSLSWDCTRTGVEFTSPANGSSQVGYNLTVNYTHLMVSIGDWYLDSTLLESFNTSNNSIRLTGLTMGWHTLCAQVSGVGNQQGNYCLSFQMTPFFPLVSITAPATNTVLAPTQSSQMVSYTTSNVTSGYWLLNGANIGSLNLNASSVQITGLQYGNNTICIVGLGLSNLVDTDCISIWRSYPPVTVTILSPLEGAIIYGQSVTVVYTTANVTSATWYVDWVDVGPVQLNQSSRTFSGLFWGGHTFCISPRGLDGVHTEVCANVSLVAPPLEVQIISPANGSSVPGTQVTIGYSARNATSGNWTLNGTPVMSVTLWSQQAVILDLARGPNVICLEAFGLNGQSMSRCITIIGHNLDSDGDGVPDHSDNCPDTPPGTLVTSDGCTDPTSDIDQDGVPDLDDTCPNTPAGEIPDANGCGPSQRDSDGDGVSDADDACNNTAPGAAIDEQGCADSQVDSDGDGVFDDQDAFPLDPTQSDDRDGDGYGDNSSGNSPDHFPDDGTQWSDFDRDGWGDNPLGNNADDCPTIAGVEDGELGRGCPPEPDEPEPPDNNTGNGTDGNQTGNETAPDCPICGLDFDIPASAVVNRSVQFTANASMTLGAEFWGEHTLRWDFNDGSTATGGNVSHTYLDMPSSRSHLVTLCVDFTTGPEECLTRALAIKEASSTDDNNSEGDGSQQGTSGEGGSFIFAGLAALGAFMLGLFFASMVIMRLRRPDDAGDAETPDFSTTPEVQETAEVDESGYEWMENPVGSGHWFYRDADTEQWTYWEQ